MVDALEDWASREAASIMVGLFVVAAGVMALAVPPSLVLGGRADGGRRDRRSAVVRARMLTGEPGGPARRGDASRWHPTERLRDRRGARAP